MRIVFICKRVMDGRNRAQFQRSFYLAQRSNLVILSMEPTIALAVKERAEMVKVFPLRVPELIGRYLFALWSAFQVINFNQRIDLIYTTYQHSSILSGYLLKRLGFKWIADIWDDPNLSFVIHGKKTNSPKTWLTGLSYAFSHRLIKTGLKRADLVICALHPDILDEYGISDDRLLPVTNGVDLDITQAEPATRSDGKFRLLFVGYVWKIRGIDVVLEAVWQLTARIPEIELILIGHMRPEDHRWFYATLTHLKIEPNVTALGELEHADVLRWLEACDVCLFPFPRTRELEFIYPIKVLEYMAMGKPIIASNLKGVSCLVEDGESALLYEPGDAADMARVIQRAYDDEQLRTRLGENAHQRVQNYQWRDINRNIFRNIERFSYHA